MVLGRDVYRYRVAKSSMTAARQKVSRSFQVCRRHIHRLLNEALPTISATGAFGAHSGLHSLVVGPHNQQRKLSPPTKDSKPPRNEKDEGEDLEKTGESEKPRHVLAGSVDIKIEQGTRSGLGAVTEAP